MIVANPVRSESSVMASSPSPLETSLNMAPDASPTSVGLIQRILNSFPVEFSSHANVVLGTGPVPAPTPTTITKDHEVLTTDVTLTAEEQSTFHGLVPPVRSQSRKPHWIDQYGTRYYTATHVPDTVEVLAVNSSGRSNGDVQWFYAYSKPRTPLPEIDEFIQLYHSHEVGLRSSAFVLKIIDESKPLGKTETRKALVALDGIIGRTRRI